MTSSRISYQSILVSWSGGKGKGRAGRRVTQSAVSVCKEIDIDTFSEYQ